MPKAHGSFEFRRLFRGKIVRMKYKKSLLVLPALLLTLVFASPALAQTSTTDDSNIQESLQQEGVNEAPKPVEVEEVQLRGTEPYSGFVDENGNPMSDEEYAAYLEDQKGVFKKYPWVLPVALLVIAGVVVGLTVSRKKKNQ